MLNKEFTHLNKGMMYYENPGTISILKSKTKRKQMMSS